jgi:CubicO group peptidase (beta-lactamase class C family)
MRTSVRQLSNYARAYLNGGEFGGKQILKPETVDEMLTDQRVPAGSRTQGLTWSSDRELNNEPQWGHGGSDPGSNTDIRILPRQGIAAIVFTNTNGVTPTEISNRLLEVADGLF